MTTDQIINLVATGVAVGAVVYGYLKGKNAGDVAETLALVLKEVSAVQSIVGQQVNSLKEPLDAAVRQLPKTRSKKAKEEQVQ